MEKRKIALFAASHDGEALDAIISGIKQRLEGSGMDLYVFLCFPGFGLDAPDNIANFNVYSLPTYEDYDGFIFAINVVQGYAMLEKYHQPLLQCKKPKVSLEYKMDGVPTIVPDGYDAEYRLVEHLIKEHGCRKINYVGGSPEHPDNILRKKAYMDALTANGIPIEEDRIRDYSYMEADGHQAYQEFKELGIETPDAVVCANDSMALGYCLEAEMDGKYPPDDFLITGYDNDDSSRAFTPLISTVDKNVKAMGYLGCDVLLQILKGENVEPVIRHEQALVLRGSCGCYSPEELVQWDNRELQRQILLRVREETEYYETLNMVRQNLAISDSEGLFNFYLMEVMKKFTMYGHCMCVNQNIYYGTQPIEMETFSKYDEEQYVFSCMKHGKEEPEVRVVKTRDLVPPCLRQQDEETHVYMCMALHRFGACIGYVVFVDAKGVLHRKMGLYMMGAINSAYSNLRNLENLRKMNKRLDAVYVKDALTDMYNRFGYMRDGYEMFEKSKAYGKPLMVMFMDMDRLKEINDIYGHSHGDNALSMFSGVLKSCAGEDKIAVRYGGDEFLIIGLVENQDEAEAFKQKLEKALDDANAQSGLQYQIEASIGYVLTDGKRKAELDDYVEEADALMYEVKKRNRKNRQSYSAQ